MSTFTAPASATDSLSNYDLEGARARRKKRKQSSGDKEQAMTQGNTGDALKLFIPITKVDVEKRLVYGVATAEMPDQSGEVCDYATTKPLYEKWSADFAKVTDGKSFGNLRAMHGNVAAGKLTEIAYDDAAKRIEICGKVVDDAEWNKCLEGVYTGFSQGGRYIKRWKDGDVTKYTAEPAEVSLVDNPCLKEATFQIVKADGSTEMRKFIKADPAASSEAKAKHHDDKAKEHDDGAKAAASGSAEAKAHMNAADEHRKAAQMHRDAAAHYKAGNSEDGDKMSDDADDQSDKAEEASDACNKSAGAGDLGKDGDWEQVWVSKRLPDQKFKKKAEMLKALADLDATEAARKQAKPVFDALTELKDKITKAGGDAGDTVAPAAGDGVQKKDFSDDDRKKLAGEGKAMKDGSYPIEDKDDLEHAVSAFGRAKNKAATKRHIIKRAKALKATDMLPADWPGSTKDKDASKSAGDRLGKGADLWSISDLLLLLDGVSRMEDNAELPSWSFGNAVDLPKDLCDRFGAALVELGDIAAEMLDIVLNAMKEEEADEAINMAARAADLVKLVDSKRLAKAGAKHSAADKDRIKKAHDLLVDLDEDCCPAEDDDDDAEKMVKTIMAERAADQAAFTKQLEEIMGVVKTIAAQPLPMGTSSVTGRVVEKSHDFGTIADAVGNGGASDGLERLGEIIAAKMRQGA